MHLLNHCPHLETQKDPWGVERPAGLISFVNELYLRERGTDLGFDAMTQSEFVDESVAE